MTDICTGPAFPGRTKSLAEQLELSLLLVPSESLPPEYALEEVHRELEEVCSE